MSEIQPQDAPKLKPPKIRVRIDKIDDESGEVKKKNYDIKLSDTVAHFTATMRKVLRIPASDSLFFYIHERFSPSLDTTFEILARHYAEKDEKGKEVLHLKFSTTPVYG
ncbi:hypothetical protein CRE_13260 [Caenorhabditis remanei]|uniref:Ubiquitin-like protein ATG12 n=1 Tax=Caenorhabditis remanei TaxID=31234 RepID=E3M8D0_CAERE|nr:hypothetical protein CRE_13260 [Caenorhabditis remanei]